MPFAVPVQPVLLEGSSRLYSMFKDYWNYHWVLSVYQYKEPEPLARNARGEGHRPCGRESESLGRATAHDRGRTDQGSMTPRRFPPPWSVEVQAACFVVRDHNGQQLAYVYFRMSRARWWRALGSRVELLAWRTTITSLSLRRGWLPGTMACGESETLSLLSRNLSAGTQAGPQRGETHQGEPQ